MAHVHHECHKPDCSWLPLHKLSEYEDAPELRSNKDVSGLGVLVGFSVTAYLTLFILMVHYVLVYEPERPSTTGRIHPRALDRRLLGFLRRFMVWRPSRRFEYAMEKSVFMLSDTQLVTGLAILSSGYSQLKCGISAYHWQILVYIAWFCSFSFLSAMTFLQSYLQRNRTLRMVRLSFMFILAVMIIVALLPTGSDRWLNLLSGPFYPGLNAECYFRQLGMSSFTNGGMQVWSMILSVLVVSFGYVSVAIKLFNHTSASTRYYLRDMPGQPFKRLLRYLYRRGQADQPSALLFRPFFLLGFSVFVSCRAGFDIAESFLWEIIWLGFGMAWGTIKLFSTRYSARFNADGWNVGANPDVLTENSWSFGQTLPLFLLLLPVISMVQIYFDADAKHHPATSTKSVHGRGVLDFAQTPQAQPAELSSVHIYLTEVDLIESELARPTPTKSSHHSSIRKPSTPGPDIETAPRSILYINHLPTYPYETSFYDYPWFLDHIILFLSQIGMLASFALFLLNYFGHFLGLSMFLRSRLFLIWTLGVIPFSLLLHLTFWQVGAWLWFCIQRAFPKGIERMASCKKGRAVGRIAWGFLRFCLAGGIITFTFFMSLGLAGM